MDIKNKDLIEITESINWNNMDAVIYEDGKVDILQNNTVIYDYYRKVPLDCYYWREVLAEYDYMVDEDDEIKDECKDEFIKEILLPEIEGIKEERNFQIIL